MLNREKLVLVFGLAASACAHYRAIAQPASTWTGIGNGWNDPYSWTTFPGPPAAGAQLHFRAPYVPQIENVPFPGVDSGGIAFDGPIRFDVHSEAITLTGNAEISAGDHWLGSPRSQTPAYTIGSNLHGTAGLLKTGPGAVSLTAAGNSYTGGTRILDGLLIAADTELGQGGGTLILDGGGIAAGYVVSRPTIIGANNGTILSGSFGPISGVGTINVDMRSATGDVRFFGPVTTPGAIRILDGRVTLHGLQSRLAATTRVEVGGKLFLDRTSSGAPSQLDGINDAATISVSAGSVGFRPSSAAPERFETLQLDRGRVSTIGSFGVSQITRTDRSTWLFAGLWHPTVTNAPTLLGSGPAGSPTVGVLPYASAIVGPIFPVTVDNGVIRPLMESELIATDSLADPFSPEVNAVLRGERFTHPITVRSLTVEGEPFTEPAGTININGGGVYLAGGVFDCPVSFGAQEGFIHAPSAETAYISGPINGSAGLTLSGSVALGGLNPYTGPTTVNGRISLYGDGSSLGADDSPVTVYGDSGSGGGFDIFRGKGGSLNFDRDLRFVGEGRRPSTLTLTTFVGAGTVNISSDIEASGFLTIGTLSTGTTSLTLSGSISGSAFIEFPRTNGTITLAGDNTYTGGTALRNRVRIASDSAFGTGPLWIEPGSGNNAIVIETVGGPRTIDNVTHYAPNTPAQHLAFTGAHALTFTQPVYVNNSCDLTLNPSAPVVFAGGAMNQSIRASGTGTLELAWYRGEKIGAFSGGHIRFTPGQNAVTSRMFNIDVTSGSTIDLADHSLIMHLGAGSATGGEAGLRSFMASGRLYSSVATTDPRVSLGYAYAAVAFGLSAGDAPVDFGGQMVRSEDLLIQYTLRGDTDLDRDVDLDDFGRLAAHFNAAGTNWQRGDFDYNGVTNIDDFGRLAAHFNQSLPAARPMMIPEPAMSLIAFCGMLACRRRRV